MTIRTLLLASAGAICTPALAFADVGSSNVAAIEPPTIAHPDTRPCTVTLFQAANFGANAVDYAYAPPASCPGPWAKVVLSTDISVAAGRQYDRTGTIWLDGVALWFGTTAEPRAALAPSWHVERDVTDDTALFERAGTGHVLIANYQSDVYTSPITATARLTFYPADAANPAPRTPDLVIGFGNDAGGDTVALNDGAATLSRTLTLPSNIESARFDAFLQGQNDDEFWYSCVPDALATTLQSCGGGAFREGELAVDGRPAGVAPVYPVIFTGGIDPYLWEPTPDISTLDLKPFAIELTPFAGALDAPGPHTLSLSVAGANDYFSVTGTLYLYLDHGRASDTGTLLADTLPAAPSPSVTNTQTTSGSDLMDTVTTASDRNWTISGTLDTSHGRVVTSLSGATRFSNVQHFDITPTSYAQDIAEDTETTERLATTDAAGTRVVTTHQSFPLALGISNPNLAAPTYAQNTVVAAGYLATSFGGPAPSLLAEAATSRDTLLITGNAITGHEDASSGGLYASASNAGCVARVLASSANVLTLEQNLSGCAQATAVAARAASVAALRTN